MDAALYLLGAEMKPGYFACIDQKSKPRVEVAQSADGTQVSITILCPFPQGFFDEQNREVEKNRDRP